MPQLKVTDQHRRELIDDSAIDPDVIAERGYETVNNPRMRPDPEVGEERFISMKFSKQVIRREATGTYPFLWLPMYSPAGARRPGQIKPRLPIRRAHGREQRYVSPRESSGWLDVHPRNVDRMPDPTVPLWITEGIKKGDALTSRGRCAVTILGVMNWRGRGGPSGDWEYIQLKGRKVFVCFDADVRTNRDVAVAMRRIGQFLRSKQAEVWYIVVPDTVNDIHVKGVDDYFAAGGTVPDLAERAESKAPDPALTDNRFLDAVIAETMVNEILRNEYLYTVEAGWLCWTGDRWSLTTELHVLETVRRWVLDQMGEAVNDLKAGRGSSDDVKGWQSLTGLAKERAMITFAQGILIQDYAVFDQIPDYLNCPNGIINLRTGELSEHDPEMLMTKIAGAEYHPLAIHPDWTKALRAVPPDSLPWFQERLGQALTGVSPPAGSLVISVGDGANGKSTIVDATLKAAGTYGAIIDDRLLMPDRLGGVPVEVMELLGVRYAVIEETPETGRLNTQRLKKVVDTKMLKGRYLYKPVVNFPAIHSLFVNTNHRPILTSSDHASWRRLAMMQFPYRFLKAHEIPKGPLDVMGDLGLKERVTADPSVGHAVLAWMVAGAIRWYARRDAGIDDDVPESVTATVDAWRRESDPIVRFVTASLEGHPGSHISSRQAYEIYRAMMERDGQQPLSNVGFGRAFMSSEFAREHRVEVKVTRSSETYSDVKSEPMIHRLERGGTYRAYHNVRWLTRE